MCDPLGLELAEGCEPPCGELGIEPRSSKTASVSQSVSLSVCLCACPLVCLSLPLPLLQAGSSSILLGSDRQLPEALLAGCVVAAVKTLCLASDLVQNTRW